MSVRVGDAVFIRTGIPATVNARDSITGQLQLESDTQTVKTAMRHGYLNGLAPETRQQLYAILDEVKGHSELPEKRVEELSTKLSELEQDPRNLTLAKYLKAEMVHIMNTNGIKPKEYSIHESKAR